MVGFVLDSCRVWQQSHCGTVLTDQDSFSLVTFYLEQPKITQLWVHIGTRSTQVRLPEQVSRHPKQVRMLRNSTVMLEQTEMCLT